MEEWNFPPSYSDDYFPDPNSRYWFRDRETMDPEKRRLLKVDITDAALAESTFSMLMGEDVSSRRAFIEDNALNVSYLDV